MSKQEVDMKKFIITWDAGYGQSARVVLAKDEDHAEELAYEAWKEEADRHADYGVEEYSEARAQRLQADDDT